MGGRRRPGRVRDFSPAGTRGHRTDPATLAIPRLAKRLLLLALVAGAGPPAAAAEPLRPVAQIRRVVLISIDGLRPDLLLRAHTPALHRLMDQGAFSMWAQTTAESVTLPSHVSMLTGVPPSTHGITWNDDRVLTPPVYPARPTLFELARRAGYTTAMVAGKSKFSTLRKPGTLDWSYVPRTKVVSDRVVTDAALTLIDSHRPDVLFVHLPGVDTAGHAHGWGSGAQLAAIATADSCVGTLIAALRSRGLLDSTVIVVTADHGGAGKSHGPNDPRSRHIPWIAAGPGVRPNFDLTTDAGLTIRTEDTFATICWLLAIPVPEPVEGRPVTEAMSIGPRSSHSAARR